MIVKDHDFALWAFGEVWNDFLVYEADSIDLLHAWNKLHRGLLELNSEGCVLEDMEKMKQLWMENKHG